MDTDKRATVRRRHILFSAHLLLWLIARLGVAAMTTLTEPQTAAYAVLLVWAGLLVGHWLALSVHDARDRIALPFRWLNRLLVPRERRWLLLIIDAMLWFISEAGAAGVIIPHYYFARYESLIGIIWTLQTAVLLAHLGLATYAEIHERAAGRKRKNDDVATSVLSDDGELIDFPGVEDSAAAVKQELRHD
jgi:hypothetical protein